MPSEPVITQVPIAAIEQAAIPTPPAQQPAVDTSPVLSIDDFDTNSATHLPSRDNVNQKTGFKNPPKTAVTPPNVKATDENKEEIETDIETDIKDTPEKEDVEDGDKEVDDTGEVKKDEVELTDAEKAELKVHGNSKRDFTGFTPEEAKLLKNLDNPRFLKLSKTWRALKEEATKAVEYKTQAENLTKQLREGGVPESWTEHPDAYQLSPEYRQVSQQYSKVDYEENFYDQQLANVKDGKPWQQITGYDRNTSQPILSAPLEASNQADIYLNKIIARAAGVKAQLEGRVANMQQNFTAQHNANVGGVKQQIDKVVNNLIAELKPVEADEKMIAEAMPPSLRNHPLSYGYIKLGALVFAQARHIKSMMDKTTVAAKVEGDRKLAGPNINKMKKDPTSSNGKGKGELLDLDVLMGRA